MSTINNPLVWADFPDLDVIRVEDTYYMVSTTMHMMPGCVILRSYDLLHWEIASYVYETLDSTLGQRLSDYRGIYGQGMWAASIRFHKGKFYICFAANDTKQTYLYSANSIDGPWDKKIVEGFYHDCSLLFDEDDKVYFVYGNREIHLTQLKPDLSGPMMGGLDRVILKDTEDYMLGFEGSHVYKINGKYYVFFIHWPKFGNRRRTEACYVADSLKGKFCGGDILDDDLEYHNKGIAQGGIVDTPDGDWYAILFQDHDAVGRIPVLVSVHWKEEFPVLGVEGKVSQMLEVKSTRPEYKYAPLFASDDFKYTPDVDGKIHLNKVWQWNHEPDNEAWSVVERPGYLRIKTTDIRTNVIQAVNSLTQRTKGPACEGIVKLDGSGLNNGDYAGISAFQSRYGFIALTKEQDKYYVVMQGRSEQKKAENGYMEKNDSEPGIEYGRAELDVTEIKLKVVCNFEESVDEADFYFQTDKEWIKLGATIHMEYTLDHFMGYRFALSFFSTKQPGGYADFDSFTYIEK